MIVDANLLLYAVDTTSAHHAVVSSWWQELVGGDTRVGLPWQSIGAFVRISTHPRIMREPFAGPEAWSYVEEWLALGQVWVPPATERTARLLARLLTEPGMVGDLVPDAQLAALAIEHGVPVASADGDFARFEGLRWVNPLRRPGRG